MYIYIYIYIHTYIHLYIHIHIHTYIGISVEREMERDIGEDRGRERERERETDWVIESYGVRERDCAIRALRSIWMLVRYRFLYIFVHLFTYLCNGRGKESMREKLESERAGEGVKVCVQVRSIEPKPDCSLPFSFPLLHEHTHTHTHILFISLPHTRTPAHTNTHPHTLYTHTHTQSTYTQTHRHGRWTRQAWHSASMHAPKSWQVKILKSLLATRFTKSQNYRADFEKIYQLELRPTCLAPSIIFRALLSLQVSASYVT